LPRQPRALFRHRIGRKAKPRLLSPLQTISANKEPFYWSALATVENALFALEPISLTVPITNTRMTANITAYSAMSCP
jgi:hypothetical protein